MKLGTKILTAAMLALTLSQAACGGRKPQPAMVFGEACVDALILNLRDERVQIRYGAVRALATCKGAGAKKAIDALQCMVGDENSIVREEAKRALRKLDPAAGELAPVVQKTRSMS